MLSNVYVITVAYFYAGVLYLYWSTQGCTFSTYLISGDIKKVYTVFDKCTYYVKPICKTV